VITLRILFLMSLSALSIIQLSGCAVVAGAGVATGATVANDKRTTGTFIDDELIELKVIEKIRAQEDLWQQSHFNATSFNNIVLLTGETPSEQYKAQIAKLTAGVQKVRKVHNEIVIAAPSSMLSRSGDTWITGKVKTGLLNKMVELATRVKVVTEKGVVYLMGLVTHSQAGQVTEVARRIGGVERVVKLFEYTD